MKVLLVDDDAIIRRMFDRVLQRSGYTVNIAADAENALESIEKDTVDIVISDIRMPGLSGLDLLRHVKENEIDCEVILMTSYASVDTAIQALREGAFDYLTKPVSQEKLIVCLERATDQISKARNRRNALKAVQSGLQAIMGDAAAADFGDQMTETAVSAPAAKSEPQKKTQFPTSGQYLVGPVTLDLDRFVIYVNDKQIDATPSEFEILHTLCRNPERVLTPQELVLAIRGYTVEAWEAKDVIRPHISNLRRKLLAASPEADIIGTVRSVGYMLKSKSETVQ